MEGRPLDELDGWQLVRADISARGAVHRNEPQWVTHGHFGDAETWPPRDRDPVVWRADRWLKLHPGEFVALHQWTSGDPWLMGLQEEARDKGIPLRLYPAVLSSDDFQRASFGSKRGIQRKGFYMWCLQLADIADPPVYTLAVTADKDDEPVLARQLVDDLYGSPSRSLVTTEARWREPGPWAPLQPGQSLVRVGGRESVVTPCLLVFLFRKYVSDMPQQMDNIDHKRPGGLQASKYTWDHREQYRDPLEDGGEPVLHHSRLVQGAHRQHAACQLAVWRERYGWKGLADKWSQMLGLADVDEPRYGHLPMWIMAVNEVAHLAFNGFLQRAIDWVLRYMMAFDPDLLLFEFLARNLPWGSLCSGSEYWRALKMPKKKKAAGQWQLWVTVLQVVRLGYPLTAEARRQLAVLERAVTVVGRGFYVDSHEATQQVLYEFRVVWPQLRTIFQGDVNSPTFAEMVNLIEVHLNLENCMQHLNGLRAENKHQDGLAGGNGARVCPQTRTSRRRARVAQIGRVRRHRRA